MSVRSALALLGVVAAGGLWAGCNLGNSGDRRQAEATQGVQRGVTPGGRTLVVDGYNGDITLRDTSAREADLTFTKRARAASQSKARKLLSRIRIEERGGHGEFAYKLASGIPDRTSVDVRGSVPQGTRLRLHLRGGDIALSGVRGPLDVNDENGDIRIGGAAQATRAETRNGSVEVGMHNVPPGGEVRLRTANGDVKLTLPASTSAGVEARTDAGEIDVSGLRFSNRERERRGAGARFEGELGSGDAKIRLRTENGDVTLRQGTVRRLPGVAGGPARSRPDTTARDTTARGTTRNEAGGDTTGLLGPPPQHRRRQPSGQPPPVPYTDTPPPMLRRPNPDTASAVGGAGNAGAGNADTSGSSIPAPVFPSPRRDTTRQ